VFVEGRLQSRSWETPDGQKRSTLEVVAQNVQFLGKIPRPVEEESGVSQDVPSDEGTLPPDVGESLTPEGGEEEPF